MISLRPQEDRGHLDHGWLDTYHSFSFGSYHDPERMGFRALRVLNEDVVQPGQGFGTHPHRDMEIVTLILSGSLQHRDSTGGGSVIDPGIMQHMSAGRGIEHSEFNPSQSEPVHLIQIWLLPTEHGLEPSYQELPFDPKSSEGTLVPVATPDGRGGSLTINSRASLASVVLKQGQSFEHSIPSDKHIYAHVVKGRVQLTDDQGNPHVLEAGSAAALSQETALRLSATQPSEVLVFDLD